MGVVKVRQFLVVLMLIGLATACGGGPDPAESTDSATPVEAVSTPTPEALPSSAGCDLPRATPGEYSGVHQVGDLEQPYSVVVPEAYSSGDPVPLYLHMQIPSADDDVWLATWRPYVQDIPGVMVMVTTSREEFKEPENIIALADEVSDQYCIDPHRIHALAGYKGIYSVRQLACEQADRIASVAIANGDSFDFPCNPSRPVPLLAFTGDIHRPGMTRLVDMFVDLNGCDPDPEVEDVGSGVVKKTYQDCRADVVFYDIEGMSGYEWPMHEATGPGATYIVEYDEVDYIDDAIAFFASHPLP